MADDGNDEPKAGAGARAPANIVAFLVVFGFIWLVFDNMALAFLFALVFAGASEVAQRKAARKPD